MNTEITFTITCSENAGIKMLKAIKKEEPEIWSEISASLNEQLKNLNEETRKDSEKKVCHCTHIHSGDEISNNKCNLCKLPFYL